MVKKNKKPVNTTAQEAVDTGSKAKKILIVVLAILVVVAISVAVDYSLRNPRVEDETAALNQIYGQGVLSNNREIVETDPVVTVQVLPIETINGKEYYPVEVITGEEPNTKLYGPYYVAIKNSKIFTKDAAGQLVPYGV